MQIRALRFQLVNSLSEGHRKAVKIKALIIITHTHRLFLSFRQHPHKQASN